jgi:hypothetical protein
MWGVTVGTTLLVVPRHTDETAVAAAAAAAASGLHITAAVAAETAGWYQLLAIVVVVVMVVRHEYVSGGVRACADGGAATAVVDNVSGVVLMGVGESGVATSVAVHAVAAAVPVITSTVAKVVLSSVTGPAATGRDVTTTTAAAAVEAASTTAAVTNETVRVRRVSPGHAFAVAATVRTTTSSGEHLDCQGVQRRHFHKVKVSRVK